jgi:DNA-binding GntR family transcriptional regulator
MTKALSPIEDNKRTLAMQVGERIRYAILNRTLPPGSRINQYQLAEDLQVSLVPVREALKTLEAEGLVMITPRRGAFVTEISMDDLDELYFARKLLEGEAIALACPLLTDDDFAYMRDLIRQMKAATASGDIPAFMQHNRDFHMRIYAATRNRYLLQMIDNLWERSELYRYRYMFILRNADVIHQEHDDIYHACYERSAEHARALAQHHIWQTRNGVHHQLEHEFSATEPAVNGKQVD